MSQPASTQHGLGTITPATRACYLSVIMAISPKVTRRAPQYFALLLLAVPALAAMSKYSFSIESEGAYTAVRRGQMLVSTDRWRIDLDDANEVRAHDSVIGGGTEGRRIALNHANKTWYYLDAAMPTVAVPSLLDFYRRNPTTFTKFQKSPGSQKAGVATTSFRFNSESKIGPESLKGDVAVEIEVASSEPRPSQARVIDALRLLTTGINDLDSKLQDALARASESTGESTMTITRRCKGASPMKQVIRIRVERAGELVGSEDSFKVPEGYQHQPPVIGFPGGPSMSP